jgi:7-cyano-7-deazaguanine synthase in queuosine biosynthesis
MTPAPRPNHGPYREIDVVEGGGRARKGRLEFNLDRDLKFSTEVLESYAFAQWEAVIYDAMVVAASIEYGDRLIMRSQHGWSRAIALRIPVDDPRRWNAPDLRNALHDAAEFPTGDHWMISFVKRGSAVSGPSQPLLQLPANAETILAYSDGMDSRAVAGIVGAELGNKLIRVHVGSKLRDEQHLKGKREPFAAVPYSISIEQSNKETSARSRGFKFALITGIAAYLANPNQIIIPESSQGAIGPVLIGVGHSYQDYRNHPFFTTRMEVFLHALLGRHIRYVFPRLWATKGETLRQFVTITSDNSWRSTKSCWRNSQWSSVNGKLRQCGVCAACMLRKMSVHAAGLTEDSDIYVCADMHAPTLREAVDRGFTRWSRAYEEYAIAGALFLDHLADMACKDGSHIVKRHASLLAPALGIETGDAQSRLEAVLHQHTKEWRTYLSSLGAGSFISRWVRTEQ